MKDYHVSFSETPNALSSRAQEETDRPCCTMLWLRALFAITRNPAGTVYHVTVGTEPGYRYTIEFTDPRRGSPWSAVQLSIPDWPSLTQEERAEADFNER